MTELIFQKPYQALSFEKTGLYMEKDSLTIEMRRENIREMALKICADGREAA